MLNSDKGFMSFKKTIFADYLCLCKPRVIWVMLITSWVGMLLATDSIFPMSVCCIATIGIAFAGGSAAILNHLIDQEIDLKMQRTAKRPIATGRISKINALYFSFILGMSGLFLLYRFVNPLTAGLTLLTVLGYAVFYSLFLKHRTPQNIVIGGLAGAMPPLLGWTSITAEISAYPLILVLIIFIWTPPHFWALAIYRHEDYQKANVPMLPITHGILLTKLFIVLYTVLLIIITLLPYLCGMSGLLYLIIALSAGLVFLHQTLQLYFTHAIGNELYLKRHALRTFSFSIIYLLIIFCGLLLDHYLKL
jgi:protoheme IX farnesyltransferase